MKWNTALQRIKKMNFLKVVFLYHKFYFYFFHNFAFKMLARHTLVPKYISSEILQACLHNNTDQYRPRSKNILKILPRSLFFDRRAYFCRTRGYSWRRRTSQGNRMGGTMALRTGNRKSCHVKGRSRNSG